MPKRKGKISIKATFVCPIKSCAVNKGKGNSWTTIRSLKNHLATHKDEELKSIEKWMTENKLKRCGDCDKIVTHSAGDCTTCKKKRKKSNSSKHEIVSEEENEENEVNSENDSEDIHSNSSGEDSLLRNIDIIDHSLPPIHEICELRVPIIKIIPRDYRKVWAQTLEQCLIDISIKKDESCWLKLLILPKCVLVAPKNSKKIKPWLKSRFELWKKGEYLELWNDAKERLIESNVSSPSHRAVLACSVGNISKAAQCLSDQKIAPDNEETIRKLKEKHPSKEEPAQIDDLPDPYKVNSSNVKNALKSFDKGTSSGPFGLSVDHINQAIEIVTQHGVLETLTSIINLMLAGNIPSTIRPYLCGANLTALDKDGNDVRPIAVGTTLRRIASKCVSSLWKDSLNTYLGPNQFGNRTRGTETVIHTVREYMSLQDTEFGILKIDIKNAFNSISREFILQEVYEHFPQAFRWVNCCYGFHSKLFYKDTIITSENGTQQGDPIAGNLFCIGIKHVIEDIDETEGIDLNLWYCDDATIIGPITALSNAFKNINKNLNGIDLFTNLMKTELFTTSKVQKKLFPVEIKITKSMEFSILGSPIGSDDYCDKFVNGIIHKTEKLFKGIEALEEKQIAYNILRYCSSFCKIIHCIRTIPPDSIVNALTKFETRIRKSMECVIDGSLNHSNWIQTSLSTRNGGFGLRSPKTHSAGAYSSSVSQCYDDVESLLKELFLPTFPALKLAISECNKLSGIRIDYSSCPSQRQISSIIDEKTLKDLIENSSDRDKARLLSCSSKHANQWLNVIPNRNLGLYLSPQEFSVLSKFALGIGNHFDNTTLCPSCKKQPLNDVHATTCMCSGDRISRHNALRDTFYYIVKSALLNPTREFQIGNSKERPGDVHVDNWENGRSAEFDFAVVSPTLQRNLVESSIEAGITASKYEDFKRRRYEAKCNEASSDFIPMIVETHGAWGPTAIPIISKIADLIASRKLISRNIVRQQTFQKLSITLQRKNARCILSRCSPQLFD